MLKHLLKIALRFYSKHKLYAFINLFSLTIGLAAFALVFTYAIHEMSYDTFHHGHNQIFRLRKTIHFYGKMLSDIRFAESTVKFIKDNTEHCADILSNSSLARVF